MHRYAVVLALVGIASVAHAVAPPDCTAVNADQTVAYHDGIGVANSTDASYADRFCWFVADFTDVYHRQVDVIPMASQGPPFQCPGAVTHSVLWGWVPGQNFGPFHQPGHWQAITEKTVDLCTESWSIWFSMSSPYSELRVSTSFYDGTKFAPVTVWASKQ